MKADIQELAHLTVGQMARADEAVGEPLAIILAIKSKGIFCQADINRLRPQVLDELDRQRHCKEFGPNITQAARGFSGWARQQTHEAKKLGLTYEIDYKHLTRFVYLYVESAYARVTWRERPSVLEVEACIRSANARKAAKTRAKKKIQKDKQAARRTKKQHEEAQQAKQLRLPF